MTSYKTKSYYPTIYYNINKSLSIDNSNRKFIKHDTKTKTCNQITSDILVLKIIGSKRLGTPDQGCPTPQSQ